MLASLEDEVSKSLEYNPPPELPKKGLRPIAHTLTVEFLASLPRIRELLQTDTEAAYNGDPAALSKEEVIVAYPFIEAIAVQRLAHELYLKNIPLIPRIMTEWAHARTGMDLHPGAQIGSHFFVDHCTGTVVGETTIIGNHVKMYQGVGLVAKSLAAGQQLRGQKRHPDHRGPRDHLRRRHHHGRRHRRGRRQHHWRERVSHHERPAALAGRSGRGQSEGLSKKDRQRPPEDFHI